MGSSGGGSDVEDGEYDLHREYSHTIGAQLERLDRSIVDRLSRPTRAAAFDGWGETGSVIEPGSSSQFPFAVPENGSFEAEPKKGPPQPSWRPVRPNNKQTHSPPPAAKSSNEVAAGTAADGADKGGIKASTERSLDRKGSLKVTLKFGGTSFPLTAASSGAPLEPKLAKVPNGTMRSPEPQTVKEIVAKILKLGGGMTSPWKLSAPEDVLKEAGNSADARPTASNAAPRLTSNPARAQDAGLPLSPDQMLSPTFPRLRMGGKVRASDAIDKAVEEEGREQKPGCDEKPGNSSARADLRTKKRRQAADLPISAKTKKAKIPEMGAAVLESPMETHTVWNHVPPSSVGPSAEPQVESDEKDGTRPERKQERHRQEETERPEDKRTGREEREQAEETERLEKERSDEREKQQREQKESDRLEKEKEKMETKREEREREARERLKKDREEQEQEGGGERHHQEQTCQEDRHREAAQNPQRDAAHEVMLDIGAEHDTEAPVGRTESDCRKGAENAGWHAEEDSSRAAKRVHREESPAGDRTVASGSNMEEEQFQRKRHAPGEDPREDLEESRKEERCREKEVLLEVDRLGPRDAAEDSKPWPVRNRWDETPRHDRRREAEDDHRQRESPRQPLRAHRDVNTPWGSRDNRRTRDGGASRGETPRRDDQGRRDERDRLANQPETLNRRGDDDYRREGIGMDDRRDDRDRRADREYDDWHSWQDERRDRFHAKEQRDNGWDKERYSDYRRDYRWDGRRYADDSEPEKYGGGSKYAMKQREDNDGWLERREDKYIPQEYDKYVGRGGGERKEDKPRDAFVAGRKLSGGQQDERDLRSPSNTIRRQESRDDKPKPGPGNLQRENLEAGRRREGRDVRGDYRQLDMDDCKDCGASQPPDERRSSSDDLAGRDREREMSKGRDRGDSLGRERGWGVQMHEGRGSGSRPVAEDSNWQVSAAPQSSSGRDRTTLPPAAPKGRSKPDTPDLEQQHGESTGGGRGGSEQRRPPPSSGATRGAAKTRSQWWTEAVDLKRKADNMKKNRPEYCAEYFRIQTLAAAKFCCWAKTPEPSQSLQHLLKAANDSAILAESTINQLHRWKKQLFEGEASGNDQSSSSRHFSIAVYEVMLLRIVAMNKTTCLRLLKRTMKAMSQPSPASLAEAGSPADELPSSQQSQLTPDTKRLKALPAKQDAGNPSSTPDGQAAISLADNRFVTDAKMNMRQASECMEGWDQVAASVAKLEQRVQQNFHDNQLAQKVVEKASKIGQDAGLIEPRQIELLVIDVLDILDAMCSN